MKLYDEKEIVDYLQGFKNLFLCHKRNNIVKCGQFISGLLHDCKSNIERMVERVPESDYDQLDHFISESPWDSLAVMDTVAEKVQLTLSLKSNIGDTPKSHGLILDESGWEKSGKKSVGVSRQYIGQVGKVANGQIGVFASLCNGLCNGEQLGLHQYQVRSWKAWHHHIALSLMALHFVLQIQKDNKEEMPLLSVPDIKLIFAKKLLNKLNSDEGILNALNIRHLKRQYDIDLHSKGVQPRFDVRDKNRYL